jgi:hypothetical protein
MTETTSSNRTGLIAGGVILAGAAIAVLFVLPAETGWDPTGVGESTGLVKIADPDNPELARGMERMAQEDVLVLTDSAPEPASGVSDTWEYELAPFESVEFKYEMPEGEPASFRWEGTAPLHYDMHAHPYQGGEELTESYGIGDAQVMQGTYDPAFTGIHGWFWENRSMDNVTLRLEASGQMTHSTVFSGNGQFERPIEGAGPRPEGAAAGHAMQDANTE